MDLITSTLTLCFNPVYLLAEVQTLVTRLDSSQTGVTTLMTLDLTCQNQRRLATELGLYSL